MGCEGSEGGYREIPSGLEALGLDMVVADIEVEVEGMLSVLLSFNVDSFLDFRPRLPITFPLVVLRITMN